jgi:hypothetical protein
MSVEATVDTGGGPVQSGGTATSDAAPKP